MRKFFFISILFFLSANVLLAQKKDTNEILDQVSIEYHNAIISADSCFKLKNFEAAKKYYEKVLQMRPNDPYAKAQIKFCEKKIKEIESDNIVDRDAIFMSFDRKIKSADSLFKLKEYEKAKIKYQEGHLIKPKEAYPKDKIEMLDELILTEKYNEAIRKADSAYEFYFHVGLDDSKYSKQYERAKILYQNASAIDPKEEYPKERIKEIDRVFQEAINTEIAKRQKIASDSFYAMGNQEFIANDFINAKKYYLISDSLHHNLFNAEKIMLCEDLASINNVDSLKKFRKLVSRGDSSMFHFQGKMDMTGFDPKDLKYSAIVFKQALRIKQDSKYVLLRMDRIAKNLENDRTSLDDEAKTIVNKDSLKKFLLLIDKGDKDFYEFKMGMARDAYQTELLKSSSAAFKKALNIKKNSKYIESRLKEIQGYSPRYTNPYFFAIAKADSLFSVKEYFKALDAYKEALNIKPDEKYPQEMAVLSSKKGTELYFKIIFQYYISTKNISKMKIDTGTGMLTWNIVNDKKDRTYKIGEKRWNKYLKLGEVNSKGENNSQYSFHVPIDSGLYYLCVEYKDDSIVYGNGIDVPLIGEDVHISNGDAHNYILFTKATRYEIYNKNGEILKRGFDSKIFYGDLEPDVYYLNYGNITTEFIRGKKK